MGFVMDVPAGDCDRTVVRGVTGDRTEAGRRSFTSITDETTPTVWPAAHTRHSKRTFHQRRWPHGHSLGQTCTMGVTGTTCTKRLTVPGTKVAPTWPRSPACASVGVVVGVGTAREGRVMDWFHTDGEGGPDMTPSTGCNASCPRPPAHEAPDTPAASSIQVTPTTPERKVACKVKEAGVLLMLLLLLLLASPGCCNGGYDRGGPQHSITWGRGHSSNSAVFAIPPSNVTAVRGHRARLPCQVKNLGHKDVSWIRQRDLHILTVGIFTYTTDDRFTVHHSPDTESWDLDITPVTFRDLGVYECQVSTSPKVSLPIHLTVLGEQAAVVVGPGEVVVRGGSTISLVCEVRADVEAVGVVRWFRGAHPLNYTSARGGISLEVEKTSSLTTSRLHITRAARSDSGNYTCHPKLARPASVTVHVVSAGEESAAAVQSGSVGTRACAGGVWGGVGVVWVALILATHLSPPYHPPS